MHKLIADKKVYMGMGNEKTFSRSLWKTNQFGDGDTLNFF